MKTLWPVLALFVLIVAGFLAIRRSAARFKPGHRGHRGRSRTRKL